MLDGKGLVRLEEVQSQPLIDVDGEEWTGLRLAAGSTQKFRQKPARSNLVSRRNDEMIEVDCHVTRSQNDAGFDAWVARRAKS